MKRFFKAFIIFLLITKVSSSQNLASIIDKYIVTWNEPGPTSYQSMPIGNGDIGLNVWAESKIQDPIQAAMLGLTDVAKKDVVFNLSNKASELKFPAFWDKAHDYMPDEDNGGNGENGLQQMLMQTNGKKIILLPAWPKDWNVDFKLHAPYRTTIQGMVKNGKIENLIVVPASRKVDIVYNDPSLSYKK
jgi:hypothetical protein